MQQYPLGLAIPAFGDGTLLRALDKAVVDTLDKARYIFAVTYPAIGDCYASDSHTLDEPTSGPHATSVSVRWTRPCVGCVSTSTS